jgi:hypothetical protein
MTRDNEHWLTWLFSSLVRYPAILDGLGIDHGLTVLRPDGTTDEVRLEAEPVTFRLDRYPPGWTALADTVSVPRPLHLRNRELPFWFEYLPADDLVYFQFNAVRDHPAETFAAFCDRLFGFIEDHNAGRLVIDVRWNGGGNTFLSQYLLHHLIASQRLSRRGALFVIIGRLTFSAAQNTVTAIERETSAIFVGEPTGSRPNFISEAIDFELPYSKLRANAADLFWQTSWPLGLPDMDRAGHLRAADVRGIPPQSGPRPRRHPRHPRAPTRLASQLAIPDPAAAIVTLSGPHPVYRG